MKSDDTNLPENCAGACTRVRGRLEVLLDGGLTAVEAARDEGHLEACEACAAARDDWRAVLGDLREGLAGAPDLDFALDGLDARLAAARSPKRARPGRDTLLAGLVAAAAAVLVLVALRGLGLDEAGLTDYTAAGRSLRLPAEILSGAGPLEAFGSAFDAGDRE